MTLETPEIRRVTSQNLATLAFVTEHQCVRSDTLKIRTKKTLNKPRNDPPRALYLSNVIYTKTAFQRVPFVVFKEPEQKKKSKS